MLLALISVLGLIGQSATQPLIDNLGASPPGRRRTSSPACWRLQANRRVDGRLVIGLAVAIWSASGYIGAFMDASNSVWDVPEGRPIWKDPGRLGVTVLMLVLLAATALRSCSRAGSPEGRRRDRARQHVRRPSGASRSGRCCGCRLLHDLAALFDVPERQAARVPMGDPGGLLAVVLWLVASALFAFYVGELPSYSKTYGSLGGIIVFLTWLSITNIIVLLGAELNSEMERSRADPRRPSAGQGALPAAARRAQGGLRASPRPRPASAGRAAAARRASSCGTLTSV